MKLSILAIGDEVINGKTINTNAAYLAKELEVFNVRINHHLSCIDDEQAIVDSLNYLYKHSDIVITTGGLGPTVDDLTKESAAKYFNQELLYHEDVYQIIEGYFSKLNLTMPITNKKQAYFIKGSKIIENNNGTAPGMIYEQGKQILIVLPGPPKELIPMFKDTVVPYLQSKLGEHPYVKKYRLMNIGESHVEEQIGFLYHQFPKLKIAPYASIGSIDYIIYTKDKDEKQSFYEACEQFESKLSSFIIGDWSKTIAEIVVESLIKHKITISVVESLTGGMVASSLVDVSGCSEVFNEAMVTYSNESKVNRLGVSEETLRQFGAVSEQTAIEMAEGIARVTHSNIGLSTTGIAGPLGGTPTKPVGLVYMAISYNGKTHVYKKNFTGDRDKVRTRTTLTLLYYLYRDFIKTL